MNRVNPSLIAEPAEKRSRRHTAMAGVLSVISTNPIFVGVSSAWGAGSALIWKRRRRKAHETRDSRRQKALSARRPAKTRTAPAQTPEPDLHPVDFALRQVRQEFVGRRPVATAERDREQYDKDRRKAAVISAKFQALGTLPIMLCPVTLRDEERCLHASRASIRYQTLDESTVEDKGYLLLTSERLIFSGDRHTVYTPLAEIVSLAKSGPQAFVVVAGERKRTASYRVTYPSEFLAYVSCVCKMAILSPTIIY